LQSSWLEWYLWWRFSQEDFSWMTI
jgi:hypothetical protein